MANVQFGTNTPAIRKQRLYYEGTSTIYEGMPVCFNFDTTTNILGWDNDASQARGTTTDEGYQNEGKFLRVENPGATNQLWFAGVVAAGGYCGKAGPKWVDVYEPNGAIVPVRSGVSSTAGRTVLCINNGQQYFGHAAASTQGRPVAVAEETVDRSSTNGLCLAKLSADAFLYQTLNGTSLIVGTGVTTEVAVVVNRMYYSFPGTDGSLCVQKCMGEITGAGGSAGFGVVQNILKINSASQGTPSGMYAGIAHMDQLIFGTGATATGVFAALRLCASNDEATPATVSGATVYNLISDLNMNTNAPSVLAHMCFQSDGTADPDYWFVTKDAASVGYATTSNVTGMAHIPVYIGGVGVRYLLLEDTE